MEIRTAICGLMSEMLDNPDEYGIYPTTKFMDGMEAYLRTALQSERDKVDALRFDPNNAETNVPKMFGLREAEEADIFMGATVWLFGDYNIVYKKIVAELLHAGDPWKAFCADDGCRYGMLDLYVLDEACHRSKERGS